MLDLNVIKQMNGDIQSMSQMKTLGILQNEVVV